MQSKGRLGIMGSWSSAAFHISQCNHEKVEKASGVFCLAHSFNLHHICQIAWVEIVFNNFDKPSHKVSYGIWGAELAQRSTFLNVIMKRWRKL